MRPLFTPSFVLILLSVDCAYSAELKRQQRETEQCPLGNNHRCDNGQCIDSFSTCDGEVNCDDRSDETEALCSQSPKCINSGFRCKYGACIDRSLVCDGKQDCADNSEEITPECLALRSTPKTTPECKEDYRRCNSGECIHYFSFCDGRPDCKDGSDESFSNCIHLSRLGCEPGFQCAYGACIDDELKCNGVNDCVDGSDEVYEECKGLILPTRSPPATTQPGTTSPSPLATSPQLAPVLLLTPSTPPSPTPPQSERPPLPPDTSPRPQENYYKPCVLPLNPDNGRYTVHTFDGSLSGYEGAYPGTELAWGVHVYLNFSCDEGHIIDEYVRNIVYCINGIWTDTVQCLKQCPPLFSASHDLKCIYRGEQVDCKQPAMPNTHVYPKCKTGFKLPHVSEGFPSADCTLEGDWDMELFPCQIECGLSGGRLNELVASGSPSKKGLFPWHVGVYEMVEGTYTYKCGGTIVSQFAVLTAAHCVHNVSGNVLPHSSIKVVAGTHLRGLVNEDNYKIESNVKEILKDRYDGVTTDFMDDISLLILSDVLPLSAFVMPACIDWQMTTSLHQGTEGTVAGWGLNETVFNNELTYVKMSYINSSSCFWSVPFFYRKYITQDKFCGVAIQGGDGGQLERGDDGGGFVVDRNGRYFITGVASLKSPSASKELAIFADLVPQLNWLHNVLNKYERDLSLHY